MTRLFTSASRLGLLAALVLAGCDDYEAAAPASDMRDPGRVTLHRLNNAEYDHTVRDLLGTSLRPGRDFPPDGHGFGFDNNAAVLTISPLQLELYDRAAELVVADALTVAYTGPDTHAVEVEAVAPPVGSAYRDWGWRLSSEGTVVTTHRLERPGDYRVVVRAAGEHAGDALPRLAIIVDDVPVGAVDVTGDAEEPSEHALDAGTFAGGAIGAPQEVEVRVTFINDLYDPAGAGDRNVILDRIALTGPHGLLPAHNPLRERVLTCDVADDPGGACARDVLRRFARRAWRRPPTDAEVERLHAFLPAAIARGDGPERGVELALRAILLSPHFLFRVELDPDPHSDVSHPLSDHELAARLSYFLWSTTPDEALSALADEGRLREPDVLLAEVDRMLGDPRSWAFVDNFAGQWLYIRALADHQPDAWAYPAYSPALAESMAEEMRLFFRWFLDADEPARAMLTADFTFADAALASHYGLPFPAGVDAAEHVEIALPGPRQGLLGQAGLLTVTSHPARTSPVKRGKWVLGQLLCDEPAPPPPGVEGFAEEQIASGSIREVLAEHRRNPECALCHDAIDPIGLGLESYDGVGAWRTHDDHGPIDVSSVMPDGTTFTGPVELAHILAADPRLEACVAEQLFKYATGRGYRPRQDRVWLDALVDDARAEGASLRAFIRAIVLSRPFTVRRGEALTDAERAALDDELPEAGP